MSTRVGQGASYGATIGSAVPGIGTAVGAGIGAFAGAAMGTHGSMSTMSAAQIAAARRTMANNPTALAAFNHDIAQNPASGSGGSDLDQRRASALNDLQQRASDPRLPQVQNDPAAGIQYDRPTVQPRDTTLFDRATNMQRPDGTIQNDALDRLNSLGRFNYADRPAAQMNGDPLDEIRNFQGRAGDIAAGYASGGYPGTGGANGASGPSMLSASMVNAPEVKAMMERANVDELMNFDPSASFNQYADGAQQKLNTALDTSNRKLTNTAAGKGRLNTGFFDLDSGELSRQITGDYRSDVLQKALDTNQQKLSAITSGTGIRADDLNNLRGQYLSASQSNSRNSLDASIANAGNSLTAQRGNLDYYNSAANRDADFRISSLNQLGNSDTTRLNALNDARGYMENDRTRVDNNYQNDRDSAQKSFTDYEDQLSGIATTQRADRATADTNFNTDRNFLMDADTSKQGYYTNDRDYNLDAWSRENSTRLDGGTMARSDRDYQYNGQRNAQNDYLDYLSGESDRAQGRTNAAATNSANRQNSSNQLTGQIVGAAGSFLSSYMNGRRQTAAPTGATAAPVNYSPRP